MGRGPRIWLTSLLVLAMVAGQLPSYLIGSDRIPSTAAASTGDVLTWTSRGPLPAARFGATGAVAGPFVYLIGGAGFTANPNGGGAVNDSVNTVFGSTISGDGSLPSFTAVAAMNATRSYPAAIAHGGYLYVFGGYGGGNSNNNWAARSSIERAAVNADGSLGSWTLLATALTSARGGMGIFSPSGSSRVYLVGGETGFGTTSHVALATVQSIDFASLDAASAGTWRTEASLPSARRGAGTVAIGGRALVTGGFDATGNVTKTVFRADVLTDGSVSWSTDPIQMPVLVGIAGHAAAYNNGYLYVAGGIGNQTNTLNWIAVKSDQTLSGAWQTYPPPNGPPFATTTDSPMVSSGRDLYYLAHNPALSDWLEITLDRGSADLQAGLTGIPASVAFGGTVTLTPSVKDLGPDAATTAVIDVSIPIALTLTSMSPSCFEPVGPPAFVYDYLPTTYTVECTVGSLADLASATASIHLRPSAVGSFAVTAFVSADQNDPNSANNAASVVVTVVPDLSGVASCGDVSLPLATVDLLSGSTIVATTQASENGTWSFDLVAPNTTFGIRYTSADGSVTCTTGVTTGADGSAAVPDPPVPNLHNSTWETAYALFPDATPVHDYMTTPRDAWFKFPIAPSDQVIVSLRDCQFDCSLILFTDISQAAAALQSGSIAAVQASQRAIAPAELSPAELSPAELSPAELSPAELSPAELSPAELSPAELSPAELSPAELSPAELSPAELSPAELSPAAYSAAQTESILAISAHAGLSPELIVRNTWEHTGSFYVRVVSHDGSTSAEPFTISARAIPGACATADLTKTPSSLLAGIGAASTQTLYLTNSARLVDVPATATSPAMTVAGFTTRLAAFAALRGGTVVDFGGDAGVQADYAKWDAHKDCALGANVVADAIEDVIRAYRANGGLKYLVIAGGDNVLPFRRVPDLSGLGDESTYHVPVLDSSESKAALASGFFLSQDFYASPAPITRGNMRIYLPQEGIGRLVESVRDMTAMLDAFDLVNGTVAPKRSLSTGYDFIADLANELNNTFATEGFTTRNTLIEAAGLGSKDPSAWTADDLRAKLFGATTYDIYAVNGHFAGNVALAADFQTLLGSDEVASLAASDTRFRNALILSMGCHAGYSIVDPDGVPNLTQSVAWAEAFNGRGATVVGGTGYGYADTDFVQYSEKILSSTAKALGIGASPVAIGDALVAAKASYLAALSAPEGIDVKAAGEATLYGLPMMRYDVARTPNTSGSLSVALTNGSSSGLQYGTPVLSYALNQHVQAGVPVSGSNSTATLTYYDASGDIQVTPLQPILPRNVNRLALPASVVLRGGALYSARYTEVSPIFPRTDVATTEARGELPTAFASVYSPLRLFSLNQIADRSLVVLPLQYLSDGVAGTARLYDAAHLQLRLYTSSRTDASALADAPSITNVILTQTGTGVHVDALIGGLAAAGLEDVLVTYTTGADPITHLGTWTSLTLRGGDLVTDHYLANGSGFSEHVNGDIAATDPQAVRLFVQAVSGNAQVSVASNTGAYYRLLPPTSATATSPKHPTSLAFTSAPPATVTYGGGVSATVRLTDAGSGVNGKVIDFNFGGHHVRAITAGGGLATAHFVASFVPAGSPYVFTAAFREDADLLGSSLTPQVTISKSASSLTGPAGSGQYSDRVIVSATLTGNGAGLHTELVIAALKQGPTVLAQRATFTDGSGVARFDVRRFGDFGAGSYTVTFSYGGNAFFGAATTSVALHLDPEGASIALMDPGPTAAGVITLHGTVTQDSDGSPGDLTKATVGFVLTPDNGAAPIAVTRPVAADGTVTLTLTLAPALYTVVATVGGSFTSAPASLSLPLYDSAAFVTGGGSVITTPTTSPAGSVAIPAGKKATFAFSAKYQKGATSPQGTLVFDLHDASGLSIVLSAKSIDWLVISGGRAEVEGNAALKDGTTLRYRAIATDAATDRFELRLWDPSTGGSFDVPKYVVSSALAGGEVVVH